MKLKRTQKLMTGWWGGWEGCLCTFNTMFEGRKHKIVDVHPNGSTPVGCIMLCVVFHVYRAVQKPRTFSKLHNGVKHKSHRNPYAERAKAKKKIVSHIMYLPKRL
jgi:hypothetical protein